MTYTQFIDMKFKGFGFGRDRTEIPTEVESPELAKTNIVKFPQPQRVSMREEGFEDIHFPSGNVLTIEEIEAVSDAITNTLRRDLGPN